MSCHVLFYSCFFFGPFGGREEGGRAGLGAFRTFVRFELVWFCLFPLSLGVWEGLRFVIVALPGLFSYPVFIYGVYFVIVCPHLVFFQCLWKTVFRDCGISCVSSYIFFLFSFPHPIRLLKAGSL